MSMGSKWPETDWYEESLKVVVFSEQLCHAHLSHPPVPTYPTHSWLSLTSSSSRSTFLRVRISKGESSSTCSRVLSKSVYRSRRSDEFCFGPCFRGSGL